MTDAERRLLSRRQMLRQGLGMGLCLPFADFLAAMDIQTQATTAANAESPTLTTEEDQFLNELEHASFLFFWNKAAPTPAWLRTAVIFKTTLPEVRPALPPPGSALPLSASANSEAS